MDRRLLFTLALAVTAGLAAVATEPAPAAAVSAPAATMPAAQDTEAAWVELVFVLDTTGSMGGLIEGAKDTIGSVVNDFASQQSRPHVRVGLEDSKKEGWPWPSSPALL